MWTAHWLKLCNSINEFTRSPVPAGTPSRLTTNLFPFYRLFVLLQQALHRFDRDLLPVRIVLFAVAIRLRIMAFGAWVSMP